MQISINYHFRAYGLPVSMRSRNKLRLVQSLEPRNSASDRVHETEKVYRSLDILLIDIITLKYTHKMLD